MTSLSKDPAAIAERWFGKALKEVTDAERRVIESITGARLIAANSAKRADAERSFAERASDALSSFGGSWAFIGLFMVTLVAWTVINTGVLGRQAFDPYPYIFLNLVLSMLAAIQAPVILMSQNRQGERDRIAAQHDYEVNLRAEIAIMALHDKIDALRLEHLEQLLTAQTEQISLLRERLERRTD